MKKIIFAALVVAAMASCTKQESVEEVVTQSTTAQEIKFSSGIQSRVSGNEWEMDDQIGIYGYQETAYYENGSYWVVMSWGNFYSPSPYRADSAGAQSTFSIESGYSPMLYPEFDFSEYGEEYEEEYFEVWLSAYAFYPYSVYDAQSDVFALDISDQSDLEALDVLCGYGTLEEGQSSVDLEFYHNMASVQFNIIANETVTSLEGLSFEIENVAVVSDPTSTLRWTTSPTEYGTLEGVVSVADDSLSAEVDMMLFPTSYYWGEEYSYEYNYSLTTVTLKVTLNGSSFYAPLTTNFYGEMRQTFNIAIGENAIEISGASITDWDESIEAQDLPLTQTSPDSPNVSDDE